MNKLTEAISVFVLALSLMAAVGLLVAAPVMWLWDWLMPTLFNLGEITWLQAWGLLMLSGLLVKSTASK